MKKIIVIGGSTSSTSINKQLAVYASQQLQDCDISVIDIRDFPLPIYSIDLQNEKGVPQTAHDFYNLFPNSDGIIISTAEHNRDLCAGFKNLLDWSSRIDVKVFKQKPILLLSTSTGGYGGQNARHQAEKTLPALDGKIVATFSLPKFATNFQDGKIIDTELNKELVIAVNSFSETL